MYFLVDDASFVCYLDVVEGMTFLVNFKNEQDLHNFTETVSDLKHTWVSLRDLAEDDDSNNDDSLERKISVCYKVKSIPIFTTKDLHSFECNSLLKQHLQSVLNFVNFRSTDHDELLCHNTTTWFSYTSDANVVERFETLRELFRNKTKESYPVYTDLLPLKIVTKIRNQTYRCYEWMMNGAHKTIGRINRTCLRKYTLVIKILKEHDGYVNVNTFEKFQMRKIFLKKINGETTNEVFDRLF